MAVAGHAPSVLVEVDVAPLSDVGHGHPLEVARGAHAVLHVSRVRRAAAVHSGGLVGRDDRARAVAVPSCEAVRDDVYDYRLGPGPVSARLGVAVSAASVVGAQVLHDLRSHFALARHSHHAPCVWADPSSAFASILLAALPKSMAWARGRSLPRQPQRKTLFLAFRLRALVGSWAF